MTPQQTQEVKEKKCNNKNCKIPPYKYVKQHGVHTMLGWFCSENCRKEIERNIFKLIAFSFPSTKE